MTPTSTPRPSMPHSSTRRRAALAALALAATTVVVLSPSDGVSAAPARSTVSADIFVPAGAVQGDRFHAWEDSNPATDPMSVPSPATSPTAFRPIVAVIDTGIDLSHPLFANRLLLGQDLIDNDGLPSEVRLGVDSSGNGIADQAFGHGTHVAGIIAQMAPNAWILPYRVLDSDGVGDAAATATAVDAAVAAGASIINLSFGTDDSTQVAPLDAAIARAVAANVTVIAAAGNRANSKLRYPAALPGVVAVAASDGTAALAPFSAYGNKWVDFSAPGIAVLSVVPGGGQGRWSGSSMAAGVASGLAASKLTSARSFKWSMLSSSIGGTLPDQLQTGWLKGSLLTSIHYQGLQALQPGGPTTTSAPAAPTTVAPTTVAPTTVAPATTAPRATTTVPATTVPRSTTTLAPTTTPAPTTTVAAPTTTAAKVALNSGCANTILFLLAWLRLC